MNRSVSGKDILQRVEQPWKIVFAPRDLSKREQVHEPLFSAAKWIFRRRWQQSGDSNVPPNRIKCHLLRVCLVNSNGDFRMRLHALLAVLFFNLTSARADWPQFRGPEGQGHAVVQDLPDEWNETKNVTWKVPVPGRGHSSPVIRGDQVWLTTAVEEGRSLRAVCIECSTGRMVHDVELFRVEEPGRIHAKNSYATPTSLIDGDRVYVHFGVGGTACLSTGSGELVWKQTGLAYTQPYAGASSPVLYEDVIILNCDGTDEQFVVALNKWNGQIVWKTPRAHLEEQKKNPGERGGFALMAYATPLVISVNGVPQVVSPAADHVAAYDARTGEEIWWLGYKGFSEVARPVYSKGILLIAGFENVSERVLYAVRPDGRGDIRQTHLLWRLEEGIPHVPSPLVVADELYLIADDGIATCLDVVSGEEHWKERIGGKFSASPIYADGKIYLCSEAGKTTLITPGKEFQRVSQNQLDGSLMASPAAVGRTLYLRSDTHLYRIEKTALNSL
ncbi:MAG: pyrrolo-quinoline quinone [Planctomycetaceae bacterium]|nr:pyrrolo-quinoline quinone [Planctomycetaceae bacterium]